MTIEVTKPGQLPETRQCKGTCFHCKTEATWLAGEGKHRESQHDGASTDILCPLKGCGHIISGSYVRTD